MREKQIEKLKDYKYGFSTDIENFKAPKGLNEDVIKFISNIKKEPKWLLEWRLKAFERLKVLKEPNWQKPKYPKTKPKNIKVKEIGNPTNIAKSITPTRIKPKIAGSINSAIIYPLQATHLLYPPNNF